MDRPAISMRDLLDAIARGFSPGNAEILSVLYFAAALLILFFLSYLIIRLANKRRTGKAVRQRYDTLIRHYNLTINEVDILERLALFLRFPAKKYLLLVNRGAYLSALRHLSRVDEVPGDIIASLESKLNYAPSGYAGTMNSTSDIGKGVPVVLRSRDNKIIQCISQGSSAGRLILSTPRRQQLMRPGESVTLFSYTFRRLYEFKSLVLSSDTDTIHIAAADALAGRIKKTINLPIYFAIEHFDHAPFRSEILQYSDKGAVLLNKDRKARRGDDLRIFFHLWMAKEYHLNCEVEKVSWNRKYLYVDFAHVRVKQ